MTPICAVLFDLDGVVRHFDADFTTEIESRLGLARGAILEAAFESVVLEQVTTGKISRRTWVDRVGTTLGSATAAEEWGCQPSTVDTEVLAIADALRAIGIRTAILTNGTDTIPTEAAELGLTDHFDGIFNSAEIGWAKPDVRAFQHVLDALGLAASEVFFTDDSSGKLAGAATLGMPTHHFASADELRGALRAAGVGV